VSNNGLDALDVLGLMGRRPKKNDCASCGEFKNGGIFTVEEKEIIEKLKERKCWPIKFVCKKKGSSDGLYSHRDKKLYLYINGRTSGEVLLTRRHEMSHALDYCFGRNGNCSGEGLRQQICTEIKAYFFGSMIFNKEEVIGFAVTSVMSSCSRAWTRNEDFQYSLLLRQYAEELYDQCAVDSTNPIPDVNEED
jgi:hypothetical protein